MRETTGPIPGTLRSRSSFARHTGLALMRRSSSESTDFSLREPLDVLADVLRHRGGRHLQPVLLRVRAVDDDGPEGPVWCSEAPLGPARRTATLASGVLASWLPLEHLQRGRGTTDRDPGFGKHGLPMPASSRTSGRIQRLAQPDLTHTCSTRTPIPQTRQCAYRSTLRLLPPPRAPPFKTSIYDRYRLLQTGDRGRSGLPRPPRPRREGAAPTPRLGPESGTGTLCIFVMDEDSGEVYIEYGGLRNGIRGR